MANELISERSQLLLKALIERYIREGQPVGSRALLESSGLPISPATVRNIMADLEEVGLIRAPHTSAGRVPTVQGYRLFVDSLLTVQQLEADAIASLKHELNPDKSAKELVESASQLLARITAQAGLVTLPRLQREQLRQVEFLPLSDNRVLVILVVNEREVQNRVIYTNRPYSQIELQQAANLINHRFAGRDLNEVRQALLDAMLGVEDTGELRQRRLRVRGRERIIVFERAVRLLLAENDQDLFRPRAAPIRLRRHASLQGFDDQRPFLARSYLDRGPGTQRLRRGPAVHAHERHLRRADQDAFRLHGRIILRAAGGGYGLQVGQRAKRAAPPAPFCPPLPFGERGVGG